MNKTKPVPPPQCLYTSREDNETNNNNVITAAMVNWRGCRRPQRKHVLNGNNTEIHPLWDKPASNCVTCKIVLMNYTCHTCRIRYFKL